MLASFIVVVDDVDVVVGAHKDFYFILSSSTSSAQANVSHFGGLAILFAIAFKDFVLEILVRPSLPYMTSIYVIHTRFTRR